MQDDSSAAASPNGAPHAGSEFDKYLDALRSFLRVLIAEGRFALKFAVVEAESEAYDPEAPLYVVDFSGADADLLLEKNAALLQAFEHVALKAIHLDEDHTHRIVFDCQDWRQTRLEELRLMAQVAADRVIETGAPFALNPMPPSERRVVHLALRDQPRVRTESEGRGADRQVVIRPAK